MLHATGYFPDSHDTSKDPPSHERFGASHVMPVPSRYSMREIFSGEGGLGVSAQGDAEACVGFTLGECIDGHLRANGIRAPRSSPYGIWTYARLMGIEAVGETIQESPLQNVGVVPLFAAQGMARWGVPSVEVWPADPNQMNVLPTLEQDERASAFRVGGWHRILSAGPQRLADVRVALSSNCMVAVGLSIDQAFDEYKGGELGPTDMAKVVGRHMVPLIGYGDDGSFEGLNHWDYTWGEGGFFRAVADWLLSPAVSDLIVVTGELVVAPAVSS